MSKIQFEAKQKNEYFDLIVKDALKSLRKDNFSRKNLLLIKSNEIKYQNMPSNKKSSCTLSRAVLQAVEVLMNDPMLPA